LDLITNDPNILDKIYKSFDLEDNNNIQKMVLREYIDFMLEYNDTSFINQTGGTNKTNKINKSNEHFNVKLNDEFLKDYYIEISFRNNPTNEFKEKEDLDNDLNNFVINSNDICSFGNNEKNKLLNTIYIYNNDFSKLFYNSKIFMKYCIIILTKNNLKLYKKMPKTLITTYLFLFYQFYLGGFIREDQYKIIGNILENYGFDNLLLDVIKNNSSKSLNMVNVNNKELFFNDKSFVKTDSNGNTNDKKPVRKVYNLLMGSGKTKVITPIILLYLYNYIHYNSEKISNVILILPEKLINQSYLLLKYTLELFFNIEIILLNSLNFTYDLKNKIVLITDTEIKKHFISHPKLIDFDNSIVLMDEIDLTIDPILSELNSPISNKIYIGKKIYNYIIDILFYSLNSYDINTIVSNIKIKLNELEFNQLDNFINYIKYIQNSKQTKQTKQTEIIEKPKIDDKEYKIYDIVYNIIKILPVYVTKINRKDYGIVTLDDTKYSRRILTAIPFMFAETPIIDSEFNDIILTLVLTINCYIEQKTIDFNNFYEIIRLLSRQLLNVQPINYKKNHIYMLLSELFEKNDLFFDIESYCSNNNINNDKDEISNDNLNLHSNVIELYNYLKRETNGKIDNVLQDVNLKILFCKEVLYDEIYYYNKQNTISGIDLVNSYYFKYLCGFTGTPEDRFKFLDFNPLDILPKTPESMTLEKKAILLNCKVIKYSFIKSDLNKFTENYDYVEWLKTNTLNDNKTINFEIYNVIIDVGAIFLNISNQEISQLIFDVNNKIERFIFFDNKDNPKIILKGSTQIFNWDYIINPNDFVYFDNPHITGIDLKLKPNFKALITLRKDTRYRDFIQGLYRMRQINSTQTAEIIYMPNIIERLYEYDKIKNKDDNYKIEININNDDLIKLLIYSDDVYFNNQMFYFNIQSLRCIYTIYKFKYNKYIKNEYDENDYYTNNNDLIKLTKNFDEYVKNKLLKSIKKIYLFIECNKELFKELVFNNFTDVKLTFEKIKCSQFIKNGTDNLLQTRINLNVNTNVNTNINLIISQSKKINNVNNDHVNNPSYFLQYEYYLYDNNKIFNKYLIFKNSYNVKIYYQEISEVLFIFVPDNENYIIICDYSSNILNYYNYNKTTKKNELVVLNIHGYEIFNNFNINVDSHTKYLIKNIKFVCNYYKINKKDLKSFYKNNRLTTLFKAIYGINYDNYGNVFKLFLYFLSSILFYSNLNSNKYENKLLEICKNIICNYILSNDLNNLSEKNVIDDSDIFANAIINYFNEIIPIDKFIYDPKNKKDNYAELLEEYDSAQKNKDKILEKNKDQYHIINLMYVYLKLFVDVLYKSSLDNDKFKIIFNNPKFQFTKNDLINYTSNIIKKILNPIKNYNDNIRLFNNQFFINELTYDFNI
jgi:hypothetical protein